MPKNRRVAYYFDPDVGCFSYGYGHVMKPHRIKMTHSLIQAYGLLPKLDVLRPRKATAEEMTKFHSDDYVHFLSSLTPENVDGFTNNPYLTGHDNPPYEGAFEFCSISAGGSISGAHRLGNGAADVAINWAGGLHHAKKTAASGFCYINDIVLGILELLRTFPRVLYVDIDCHHGDAVEEAFYTTDRVLTCSLHKFGDFFPGTGYMEDRGVQKGWKYSINVPFRQGLCDESFHSVFEPLMQRILDRFQPSVVVLQCGADSLSGDRLGQYNLSMDGHADCVRFFRKTGIPLMLLGGGGYTIKNVARVWTYETACALNADQDLDRNLPYNHYFEWFGPEYRLLVPVANLEDANLGDGHLDQMKRTVLTHAEEIPIAPSVPVQDVPRRGLAHELGLKKRPRKEGDPEKRDKHEDSDEEIERVGANPTWDEFDHRIQELAREVYASESSESETEDDELREVDWDEHGGAHRNPKSQLARGGVPLPSSSLLFRSTPQLHQTNQTNQMNGKKSKPPKRKFFRSEIRFRSRGEIELAFLDGLRRGVCDPVGFEMEYPDEEDEDALASPVDEGSEGEVEMEVDDGGGSGEEG